MVVVALASHTYRTGGTGGVVSGPSGRETALSEDIRRLEIAGADVRVVRRPGGVDAFAGVRGAVSTRRVV